MKALVGPLFALAVFAGGCHLVLGFEDDIRFDRPLPSGAGGQGGSTSTGGSVASGGSGGSGGTPGCEWTPIEEDFQLPFDPLPAGWTLLDGDATTVYWDTSEELIIEPRATDDFWWHNEQAPALLREVCGDFALHVHVNVEDLMTSAPTDDYHGGGILVRNPNPPGGDEHWILLTHSTDTRGELATQLFYSPSDNMRDGQNVAGAPANHKSADLLLCRVGDQIRAMRWVYAEAGEEELFTHDASMYGLPDRLQVGVTAHRFYSGDTPDALRAGFWFASYFVPSSLAECEETIRGSCSYGPNPHNPACR